MFNPKFPVFMVKFNCLVVKKQSWNMMEFVNGKDDIPYIVENEIHVPNHQSVLSMSPFRIAFQYLFLKFSEVLQRSGTMAMRGNRWHRKIHGFLCSDLYFPIFKLSHCQFFRPWLRYIFGLFKWVFFFCKWLVHQVPWCSTLNLGVVPCKTCLKKDVSIIRAMMKWRDTCFGKGYPGHSPATKTYI